MVDVINYDLRIISFDNLIEMIKSISDLTYQEEIWVKASNPNIIDNWDETLCTDFNDSPLNYILEINDKNYQLSNFQLEKLHDLKLLIDNYINIIDVEIPKNYKNYDDRRKIFNDPRWHKVVECAKETLKAFEGYKVPTDDMLKF